VGRDNFARLRDREFAKVERMLRTMERTKRRGRAERPSSPAPWAVRWKHALAFSLAAALFFGLGVWVGSPPSLQATPRWMTVPEDYTPARICAKGGPALFEDPIALALGPSGGLFLADPYKDAIFHITPDCEPSVFLSKAELQYALRDLSLKLNGRPDGPIALAFGSSPPWEGLFIAIATFKEQGPGQILYAAPNGEMHLLKDTEGNPLSIPLDASREGRYGLAFHNGALYVASSDGYIYRIWLGEHLDQVGPVELALRYRFRFPTAIAFDNQGNLYVTDEGSGYVLRFKEEGETFYRDPVFEIRGLVSPTSLAFGPDGTLFVAESGENGRIRRYLVGDQGPPEERRPSFEGYSQDQRDQPHISRLKSPKYKLGFQGPVIAVDPMGTLFVADNTGEPGKVGKFPAVYKINPRH